MTPELLSNVASKIIICIDNVDADNNITKEFYTKNPFIIEKFFKKNIANLQNNFFNCKTQTFEELNLNDISGISLPFIPFEVSPTELYKTANNPNNDAFYFFQENLCNFLINNADKIKDKAPVTFNNINILNFLKSHFFFSTKAFVTDFDYYCSFISNTIAEDRIKNFFNWLNTYTDLNDTIAKEPDLFNKLRLFYDVKIKEAVNEKIKGLVEEKAISLEQSDKEDMLFMKEEITKHYDEKISYITDTNYHQMVRFFETVFELLKFWPPWLDTPQFIDKNQTYDLYRYKLFTCLKLLDSNLSITLTPEILKQMTYIRKAEVLEQYKQKLIDEIDELLASDNTLEELKALKGILNDFGAKDSLDKHLSQTNPTEENYVYEVLSFWPEILQPEPKELEKIRNVLRDNGEVIFI